MLTQQRILQYLRRPDVQADLAMLLRRRAQYETRRMLLPWTFAEPRCFKIYGDMDVFAPLSDSIGKALYVYGQYEWMTTAAMRLLAPPGGVVIEAGAHIGNHTLLAAKLVGPRGRVIACEPNAAVASLLRRSLTRNQLRQVDLLEVAVGDRDAVVSFDAPGGENSGSARVINTGALRVQMRRLDDIVGEMALDKVDLIKMDIEDGEEALIAGAAGTLARHRPAVIFEQEGKGSPAEMLRDLGYEIYAMAPTHGLNIQFVLLGDLAEAARYRQPRTAMDLVALPLK